MSKELHLRRAWRLAGLPFMFMAAIIMWLLFDISWKDAWKGEL